MEEDVPYDSLPTVNQLFLDIRKATKKGRRWIEKVAVFFLWVEIAFAFAIMVLGIVNYSLTPSRAIVAQLAGWAFGVMFVSSVLALLCNIWLVMGSIFQAGGTFTGGVDDRIAVERKLAGRLVRLQRRDLVALADRVQLESSLVIRRIGLGALAITVLTFISGVFGKDATGKSISVLANREAMFLMAGVLAASIAMTMLYTIVDRLDRIAFVLKGVANKGKEDK